MEDQERELGGVSGSVTGRNLFFFFFPNSLDVFYVINSGLQSQISLWGSNCISKRSVEVNKAVVIKEMVQNVNGSNAI